MTLQPPLSAPSATPLGLVVAAPRSGAGKTTVTLGLMRALARSGVRVQPFKCGPDYIDPAFHAAATGRRSINLDAWAMRATTVRALASSAAGDAEIAIAEGVMGLFDGVGSPARGADGARGATADVAAMTGWPIVLVLDVSGQTETAAAVALGCAGYRQDVHVAGVILNRVASDRHLALISPAFERLGLPLLGAVRRDDAFLLPERHLGLVQASETAGLDGHLDRLADAVAGGVDMARLRAVAAPLAGGTAAGMLHAPPIGVPPPGQRTAVATDAAFSFMYPHLLRAWRAAGAEVLPFSPLADEAPDRSADALWLPGGYPELHAGRLGAARRFLDGLRAMASAGSPVHGECGGYMVLGSGLEDADGQRHAMAGLLSLETSFAKRRLHLGYRAARLVADCAIGRAGAMVFGHEFHYATTISVGDEPLVSATDATGAAVAERGARRGSVSGTFFHLIDGEAA